MDIFQAGTCIKPSKQVTLEHLKAMNKKFFIVVQWTKKMAIRTRFKYLNAQLANFNL